MRTRANRQHSPSASDTDSGMMRGWGAGRLLRAHVEPADERCGTRTTACGNAASQSAVCVGSRFPPHPLARAQTAESSTTIHTIIAARVVAHERGDKFLRCRARACTAAVEVAGSVEHRLRRPRAAALAVRRGGTVEELEAWAPAFLT